jgi:hypothetical protein
MLSAASDSVMALAPLGIGERQDSPVEINPGPPCLEDLALARARKTQEPDAGCEEWIDLPFRFERIQSGVEAINLRRV